MRQKRLFIGIPLSSSLQKRLIREALAWEGLPFFVVPSENLHVTLLFLGFVDEESLEEICEHIREATRDISPFEMHFEKIHFAPTPEKASMIWLSGRPIEALRVLRSNLETTLGYLVPERKNFRPHVNLARIRRNRFLALENKPPIEKSLSLVEPVSTITLFQSISSQGKRRYESLCEFELT